MWRSSKGQVTVEFVVFLLLAATFFGITASVLHMHQVDVQQENRMQELRSFARSVQDEIIIASNMHHGYSRQVDLPKKLYNEDYQIWILNNNLYLSQDEEELILPLPPVIGTINGDTLEIVVQPEEVIVS